MIAIAASVVGTLIAALICFEAREWSPRIVDWLIGAAVRRSPRSLRSRLNEEWHAHIEDTPGVIGKLWSAAGFLVAAKKMSEKVSLREKVRAAGLLFYIVRLTLLEAVAETMRSRQFAYIRKLAKGDAATKLSIFMLVSVVKGHLRLIVVHDSVLVLKTYISKAADLVASGQADRLESHLLEMRGAVMALVEADTREDVCSD